MSSLPQLHVSEESPPFAHLVVHIELVDLLNGQCSSPMFAVSGRRITPWSSKNELICDSEAHDYQHSNHVLEKVGSGETGITLTNN